MDGAGASPVIFKWMGANLPHDIQMDGVQASRGALPRINKSWGLTMSIQIDDPIAPPTANQDDHRDLFIQMHGVVPICFEYPFEYPVAQQEAHPPSI